MAGKLNKVSAAQTTDGRVEATFVYRQEGRDDLTFTEVFPGDADQAVISRQLIERCGEIAKGRTVPALTAVNQLFPAGTLVQIPDPPPA